MSKHAAARLALRAKLLTYGSLPAARGWENVKLTPVADTEYVTEQYVPGPAKRLTYGNTSTIIEYLPLYIVQFYVPADRGMSAAGGHVDAVLALFPPGLSFTVTDADLHVHGDPAPYAGQLLQASPGFAVVSVTVPLMLRTRT